LLVVIYGAILVTEARVGWSNVVPAMVFSALDQGVRS
jgi:hypothetical protein